MGIVDKPLDIIYKTRKLDSFNVGQKDKKTDHSYV